SGTAARSAQSTPYSVTQPTHAASAPRSPTVVPQSAPPNGSVTASQLGAKPMAATVTSSPPPQCLSVPPHAAQIVASRLAAALASRAVILPSPMLGGVQSFW